VDPKHAVMFDDIPKNLVTASQVGMATVLILHDDEGLPYRYDENAHGPFVDDQTDDLTRWLKQHHQMISQP
jgi:FMN phosphatase YigB (HAD superfamily)